MCRTHRRAWHIKLGNGLEINPLKYSTQHKHIWLHLIIVEAYILTTTCPIRNLNLLIVTPVVSILDLDIVHENRGSQIEGDVCICGTFTSKEEIGIRYGTSTSMIVKLATSFLQQNMFRREIFDVRGLIQGKSCINHSQLGTNIWSWF